MSYTTDQLDAFWSRYVTMREIDVVSLTHPDSAAYDPEFAGMLGYSFTKKLYGFGTPELCGTELEATAQAGLAQRSRNHNSLRASSETAEPYLTARKSHN
jgi:hypothetical protein